MPSEHDPKKAEPILRKASPHFVTNLTNNNEIRLKFSTVWHKWSHTVENYLILCSPLILLPCWKQLSNTINYFSTLLIHGHYRMIKTRRWIAPLVFRGLSTPLLCLQRTDTLHLIVLISCVSSAPADLVTHHHVVTLSPRTMSSTAMLYLETIYPLCCCIHLKTHLWVFSR